MTKETLSWLQSNTLIGYTDKRGEAWHYRAGMQGDEPNHYAGAIPVEDVRRRLFSWEGQEAPVQAVVDGKPVPIEGRKAIVRSDTHATLGIFKSGYRVHQYDEWLIENVATLLDADLRIGSAGLLRGGGVAWVQIEMEDTLEVQGVEYRPFLTAATSMDGTLATTYQTGAQVVVCHAKDTFVIDGTWRGLVQDHPSAVGPYAREGFEIAVRGLPFTESVTSEHRYWVRERNVALSPKRKGQLGVTNSRYGQDKAPAWVEARDIRPVIHEIGYPIDQTITSVPDEFDNLGTAYLMGYWLGNGNLHGERQFTVTAPASRPDMLDDLRSVIEERTGTWLSGSERPGCVQITATDPALAQEFATWKRTGWAQKCPAVWVETAPHDWQEAFVRGYYDADGQVDTTHGCILTSVSLDALEATRRILMRLGIPSSIRSGSDPALHSTIQGRQVNAQQGYSLRFWQGAERLGYPSRHSGRPIPYIEDGHLWSRVDSVEPVALEAYPITTDTHDYLTAFGRSHNCDNTLSAALGEKDTQRVKIRHSRNSMGRIGEVREALDIVHGVAEDFEAEVQQLLDQKVTEDQWGRFVDAYVGLEQAKEGRGKTIALNKKVTLNSMWSDDERVAPWRGTAWGVISAINTAMHHEFTVKGDRAERNAERAITGKVHEQGVKTLQLLAQV